MDRLKALVVAFALLACLGTGPAAAENVLRWASAGGALTWDPHGTTDAATSTWWQQVYETPFSLAPDLKFENRLFIRERIVDALTWEFELRPDVRFHNGTPLTAEDVIFSIERQRESSDQRHNVSIVATADAIAADRLRIQTATRDMLLPTQLRRVSVMSKAWAEQYGAVEPRSHRDAKQTYARWHANGSGPFILERADESGRIRLARNPNWWGWREHPGNIDRIEFTPVADPQHRLAMLLAGEIDLLTDPPFDAIEQIRKTPGLKLVQELELRTIFLGFDQEIPELRSSDIKGRNPFRDKRVRQAVYQAIDIEAIRRDVMRGLSRPAGMIAPPGVNGWSAELDRRLPYDPRVAKALLADVGYPRGFRVRLDCPNNRYVNDEAICRAVATQLARIGLAVEVDAQDKSIHFQKLASRNTDFYLFGWHESTLDSSGLFRNMYVPGRNQFNATGYRNPVLEELLGRLDRESVIYARDALIEEAWRLVLADVVYVPLHHQVIVWAMRDDLDFPISRLNEPQFYLARFESGAAAISKHPPRPAARGVR